MLFAVVQDGVVCPPWQLTLLQVRAAGVKLAVTPPFAVNVLLMATGAGPVIFPALV